MATRAEQNLNFAIIRPYVVETSTITAGFPVIAGSAAGIVAPHGAAADTVIGVSLGAPGETFAVGATVQVALCFNTVVRMKVGTGGSTFGKKQKIVSDGITDAPTLGGGTTAVPTIGVALDTGVASDMIGVGITVDSRVTT